MVQGTFRQVSGRRRALAGAVAVLISLGAASAAAADPFVPTSLRDAALAQPSETFKVIVQGAPHTSSGSVANDVRSQERSHPGHEHGVRHSFRSVNGVSAELTGRQITALADARGLRAITPDVPLAANVADPPTVVVAPAVSGVAQDGETLAALNGEWSGGTDPLSFSYRWLRCNGAGEGCAEIAGAVSAAFVAGPADVGSTLAVAVTATDADGATATAVSAVSDPVQSAPPPPVQLAPPRNVSAPLVSGAARDGETLSAAEGVWAATGPLTYAWQWQRCSASVDECAAVDGATEATYLLSSSDVGFRLRVVVTGRDATGSATAVSSPSDVVAAAVPAAAPPLAAVELPAVSVAGATATATPGTWTSATDLAFAYRWQRCDATGGACTDIDGATSATYAIADGDAGSTLRVTVTATDAGGAAARASSKPAAVPAADAPAAAPLNDTLPEVSVGTTSATATPGSWTSATDLSFTYRWQRCDAAGESCADIDGATSDTYGIADADTASTLRVTVTATGADGAAATATSAPSEPLADAPPVNLETPELNDANAAGALLQAKTGFWTSRSSLEFAYQWQRCDATGESCVDLDGETAERYQTSDADAGSTLRVKVTATNAAGSTDATSRATTRVPPTSTSGFYSWQLWPYVVHADALWDATSVGGVHTPAIAVVDSGVDTGMPGLTDAVSKEVTITSLPQRAAADGYGHGSFVAAVAAGRAAGEAGAAPAASIVSLDVMDDNGMALTSDVIAAADWIYTNGAAEGIRVANFSLLSGSPSSMLFDPMDRALEKLWLSGIVVVTAAGNYAVDGAASAVPYAPANDPFTIAVGAADVAGTLTPADDFAAPWSAHGHTLDGFAKPELGAPGRYMVEPVPVDSTLYVTRPDRIIVPGELQLSGTSFAAPVVAGLAADLLALHPNWTPDQVKGALMLTASPTASAPAALGVGEVDAAAAAALDDPPNPNVALEAFVTPDPDGGPTPVFDAASWGTAVRADASWGTASWGTASWGTASWGTASWGTASWGTTYWSSASWGTASWGTASWGTSAAPTDIATADFLGAGAYWMRWPPG